MGATGAKRDIVTKAVSETRSLAFATACHVQETGLWCPKLSLGIKSDIKKLSLSYCFWIRRELADELRRTNANGNIQEP